MIALSTSGLPLLATGGLPLVVPVISVLALTDGDGELITEDGTGDIILEDAA